MSLLRNIGVGRTRLIEQWMTEHVSIPGMFRKKLDFTIREDYTIDIYHDAIIVMREAELPDYIQFNRIFGSFDVSWNRRLVSTKGFPKAVNGSFYIQKCGRTFTVDEIKDICSVQRNIIIDI